MAEVVKAAARQLPGFKLGQKQVFLPNHVITFLRKEHLPPNEACFQVPLRFTKFDLRDYLWNVYNVEVKQVRAYVKPAPLARRRNSENSWYRPQPSKIMTVELVKPFQWPDAPENLEPFNQELWETRQEGIEQRNDDTVRRQRDFELPLKSKQPLSMQRKELAKLAQQMLSGEVKWENNVRLDPRWDKILEDRAKAKAKEEATS